MNKNSFYPALGTPTNLDGTLNVESFNRQVELMIEAEAQGVLCLGSMGKMATIRDKEYSKIVSQCCFSVDNRVPILVGVMDCSIDRVLDRIEALDNAPIDGVVATLPFYNTLNENEIINFFTILSKASKYPVYIYDLPGVTQSPIRLSHIEHLIKISNIRGIKTGNIHLIQEIHRHNLTNYNQLFSVFYSNLDLFDIALKLGINKNLDGMFTCTPYNTKEMYKNGNSGSISSRHFINILRLRNLFIKENVLSAYSYAMELLNCPGNYHPDYALPISVSLKKEIDLLMREIGEI